MPMQLTAAEFDVAAALHPSLDGQTRSGVAENTLSSRTLGALWDCYCSISSQVSLQSLTGPDRFRPAVHARIDAASTLS
jgi:hypothetical protein